MNFPHEDVLALYKKVHSLCLPVVYNKHPTCAATRCTLLQSNDVFLCVESGRIHWCDGDCALMVKTADERPVCPISGYCDRQPVLRDTMGDLIKRCTEELEKERKGDRRKAKQRMVHDAKHRQRVMKVIRKVCSKKLRKQLEKDRRASAQRRITYQLRQYRAKQGKRIRPMQLMYVLHVIRAERSSDEYDDTDNDEEDDKERVERDYGVFADTILFWWNSLKQYTSVYTRPYRLEYHAVAVLYTLREGIQDEGQVLFGSNRLVRKYLPRLSDVGQCEYSKRNVTHHIQNFKEAYLNFLRDEQRKRKL